MEGMEDQTDKITYKPEHKEQVREKRRDSRGPTNNRTEELERKKSKTSQN